MAYQLKELSGSMFRNDRKESDRHPDWTGRVLVNGQEYWLSAWEKDNGQGQFFSLALKAKEDRGSRNTGQQPPVRQSAKTQGSSAFDDFDDPLPF